MCYLETVTDFRQLAILVDSERGVVDAVSWRSCRTLCVLVVVVVVFVFFNLAVKERHREIARRKQRDACYTEGKNLSMFPQWREKSFREKGVNNFRAEMIDCPSSPRYHRTPITRGLTLDRKKFPLFPDLSAGTTAQQRNVFLVAGFQSTECPLDGLRIFSGS